MPALAATVDACGKFAEIDTKREKEWEECSQWWQQALVDGKELLDGIIAQVAGATPPHLSVKCSSSQGQHHHTNTQEGLAAPPPGLGAQGDSADEPAAPTADKGKENISIGEKENALNPSRAPAAALGTEARSTSNLKAANPNVSRTAAAAAAKQSRARARSRSCTEPEENVTNEDAAIDNTSAAGAAKRGREARAGSGAGAAVPPPPVQSESSKTQDSSAAAESKKEIHGNASPAPKRSKKLEWRPPEGVNVVGSKKGHPPAVPRSQLPPPASSNAEPEVEALLSGKESSAIAAEISELQAVSVSSMKVIQLRAELRKLGVSSAGLKAVLQTKLQDAINSRLAELEGELQAHLLAQAVTNSGTDSGTPLLEQEELDEMIDVGRNCQEVSTKIASVPPPARSPTAAATQDVENETAGGPAPGAVEQVGAQTRLSGTRWSGASEACSPVRVFSPCFTEAGKGPAAGSTAGHGEAESPSLLLSCAAGATPVLSTARENSSVHGGMDVVANVELAGHGDIFTGTAQMEMDDAEERRSSGVAADGEDRRSLQAASAVAESLGASATDASTAAAAAAPVVPLDTEGESSVDVPPSPINDTNDESEQVSIATGKDSVADACARGEETASETGGRREGNADAGGVRGDEVESGEAAGEEKEEEEEEGEIRAVVPPAEEPALPGVSDSAVEGAALEETSTRDDMDVEHRWVSAYTLR